MVRYAHLEAAIQHKLHAFGEILVKYLSFNYFKKIVKILRLIRIKNMDIFFTVTSILGIAGCIYVLYSIFIKSVSREILKEIHKSNNG